MKYKTPSARRKERLRKRILHLWEVVSGEATNNAQAYREIAAKIGYEKSEAQIRRIVKANVLD